MNYHRSLLVVIFVSSLATLSFELTLMRLFSISLWYHFAFMVLSIAMLGIGASGTILSVYPGLKKTEYIKIYLFMLGITMPASYLLSNIIPLDPVKFSWDRIQLFYVILYYILLSLPFFSFGLIVSTAFSTIKENAGSIYGADLCGAGAGSIAALWLLSTGGPEKIVFLISILIFLLLAIYSRHIMRLLSFLFLTVCLFVLFSHPSFINPRISPYKQYQIALRFPESHHLKTYYSPFSQVDLFRSPAVRFAPGISFKYLDSLPDQTGISVDKGTIYAITKDTETKKLSFVSYMPSSLPYEMSPRDNVLILDPKGGLSVLTAEYYKATSIFKVESNPLIVKAVREFSKEFPTGIFSINTWTGLGRTWLGRYNKSFDLIDLSLMGSLPSGSFGFNEDYRFTVEAFKDYISYLSGSGLLSVTAFILPPPRVELRLLNTIVAALEQNGIENPAEHIAAIRSWGTVTIVASKTALSPEDIAIIKKFAREKRFDLIHYPGISEDETNVYVKMPSTEYFKMFNGLIHPESRHRYISDYLFDISPVSDENPFFHYFLKIGNIREIYASMGEKWQYFMEEGYLLPVVFVQSLVLSIFFILLPVIKSRGKVSRHPGKSRRRILAYFAFLGLGFMFIEISFIQKMILPLENPSYAAAVVLSSVLISSGAGSLLSQHFMIMRNPKVLLMLSITVLFYSFLLPSIVIHILPLKLTVKIISVFVILLPAGVLMGIPFPSGLLAISKTRSELIPWAWAVNGCLSVLAPLLAYMIALSAGFKTVLMLGAVFYLSAYFFSRREGLTAE